MKENTIYILLLSFFIIAIGYTAYEFAALKLDRREYELNKKELELVTRQKLLTEIDVSLDGLLTAVARMGYSYAKAGKTEKELDFLMEMIIKNDHYGAFNHLRPENDPTYKL